MALSRTYLIHYSKNVTISFKHQIDFSERKNFYFFREARKVIAVKYG